MPDMRLIDANALVDKVRLDWGLTHQSQLISATTKLAAADAMCKLLGEVAKCRTIDAVEVVHARWRMNKKFGDYECTACGQGDIILPYFKRLKLNYCPLCGAKMDAKEDKPCE